ncbi:MAG: hypothetical protein AB7I27_07285 [Bacteriovoracaceae bacterium]
MRKNIMALSLILSSLPALAQIPAVISQNINSYDMLGDCIVTKPVDGGKCFTISNEKTTAILCHLHQLEKKSDNNYQFHSSEVWGNIGQDSNENLDVSIRRNSKGSIKSITFSNYSSSGQMEYNSDITCRLIR